MKEPPIMQVDFFFFLLSTFYCLLYTFSTFSFLLFLFFYFLFLGVYPLIGLFQH